MFQQLRPWPVAAGFLVDMVGSFVLGLALATFKLSSEVASTPAEIPRTPLDYLVAIVLGLVLVTVGGYVAARLAKARAFAHSVCVGLAVLVVTLLIVWVVPDPTAPLWFTGLSILGVVPAAALGGTLHRSKR